MILDVNGGIRADLLARQSVRALVLHGFLHATTAALEASVPGITGMAHRSSQKLAGEVCLIGKPGFLPGKTM